MSHTAPAPTPTAPRPLAVPVLVIMTVAAGASVAGNYFTQPLLGVLQTDLGMSTGAATLTVAAAQVGYALGLLLLVPLGDRYQRRGLSALLLAATGLLLLLAGSAPDGTVLLAATGLAAVTSVGAQVLVPFAAELSVPDTRARNVGVVMAGVIGGGLIGRAFAGIVAEIAGWRTVYVVTACLLLLVALAVHRTLPRTDTDKAAATGLGALLRSTLLLLVETPGLRRPIAVAALTMAAYTAHLATLTLLLLERPYGWNPAAIGLIGLVGVVGPLSMPWAGRLVDRGHPRTVLTGGIGLALAAWLVMLPAQTGQIAWLVAGLVLINVGQTAMLNAAQNTCYELRPEARSRVNAVFMTLFFVGGAVGGVVAPVVWVAGGWTGICVLGLGLTGTALALSVRARRHG